jgi:hypothetical protein
MYPIIFSIPKENVIDSVQTKSKILATIIPGDTST